MEFLFLVFLFMLVCPFGFMPLSDAEHVQAQMMYHIVSQIEIKELNNREI